MPIPLTPSFATPSSNFPPPLHPSAPLPLPQVTQNEGLRMLCSKAQAIDELESTIPAWVEAWFPGLFPAYLHVLRVDPDKLDAVKWVWDMVGWGGAGTQTSAKKKEDSERATFGLCRLGWR